MCNGPALLLQWMCSGDAWIRKPRSAGIIGMENIEPSIQRHQGSALRAYVLDYHCQVVFHPVQTFGDFGQVLFEAVQTGPESVSAVPDGLARVWRGAALQDCVQVLRVPTQGRGQGLQRPRAAAPLDGVVLKLADDGLGDMGALRKLALPPTELMHALVDGLRDCRPVFRHPFLRAPPSRRG